MITKGENFHLQNQKISKMNYKKRHSNIKKSQLSLEVKMNIMLNRLLSLNSILNLTWVIQKEKIMNSNNNCKKSRTKDLSKMTK